MKDIFGIVGGMGSHAAVSMFQQLINRSPAKKDQEYMEILIHNNSCVPDRTEGILYQGEDPFPELLRSVKLLESCGATVIVLACITAHHFADRLEESLTKAKMFNIVRETVDYTSSMYPKIKNIGILATEGTCKTGLWKREFDKKQINTLILSDDHQAKYFNNVIYGQNGVKAGYQDERLKNNLLEGCNKLMEMGAEAIIGACSELPLLISKEDLQLPYIDSIELAADRWIEQYYRNRV